MKKIILGLVIGLVLSSGIAFAAINKIDSVEVTPQAITSTFFNEKNITVYKFYDSNNIRCYVNPVFNSKGVVTSSSISCVKII